VLALRLEHRFDKREMLAMYLNLAAYGNQFAGAERASRAYFGVPAAMLTPRRPRFWRGCRSGRLASTRIATARRRSRASASCCADAGGRVR
jgi:hypothetical protein